MSQLQVTGEAKIRDIQGPVVANDGVVTALDGAASQYVRGDGTLADFPTSSGGGSSVSYYLNSSVSQGTIGGVAYRELSKDPIIGTGTDIAISSNGYVANYITDVNDPDVTIVAGGNFNCEFYFSVNNNTGNPFTYAELYKYDGTTFTLLGSSVGVPEYINQGTIIAPYYFAIPVATAALALTDRLAIRIYVNVDGRTVTLHTENGHLCQVVTTLSKGMVSLNNLTDQSQFLTTGTAGTNFAIASSGDTHTFNLPVASATNTGKLSSTDWSTFNNKQNTITDPITGTGVSTGVAYFNSGTSITSEAAFNYDASTNRLGVNTSVPNATIGANAGTDSGYSLLVKNDNANYNGIGFATTSTYGNVIGTEKLGTAPARNLTLLNQSGYISLTEVGNLGVGILTPNTGIDIYNGTTSSLWLHTANSGVTGTDGVRLALFSNNGAVLRNNEGTLSMSSEGDFYVITLGAENIRVNSVDGKVGIGNPATVAEMLTVNGSIQQSGVLSSLLKTNGDGKLIAAVAGTDYVVPSALSGYVPTSRTITINGTTQNLSADISYSVGTMGGSGVAGRVAYYNGTNSITSEAAFNYDDNLNRFGVNTNSPNATIGANANLDSGYSLLLKNSDTNYSGIGFATSSVYGNTIETVRIGSAPSRNLTLYNYAGYVSLTEAGNLGVGILTPNTGIDIYHSTISSLWLHTATSGTSGTDGVRLSLNSSNNAVLRNNEGSLSMSSESDFYVITLGAENIRVNSANGFVGIGNPTTLTSILTVNGSITQSVTSALLKTNASGTIIAAVAGTDYATPAALSGYLPLSGGTLTGTLNGINGNFSGNVGIGTTSPDTKLDVRGEISLSYNANDGLRFWNQDRSNWSSISNTITAPSSSANLIFRTSAGVALTIDPNRNATFTTNITAQQGTFSSSITNRIGHTIFGAAGAYTTGDNPFLGLGTTSPDTFGAINAPYGDKMKLNAYHGFEFKTSNSTASPITMMTININGNVGIGTSSPTRKLEVNGVTRSNAFDIYYNGVTAGFLLTETQWTGNSNNNVSIAAEGGVTNGGNITFFTNGSATERMRITSGGNVGIGTSSPTTFSGNTTLAINNAAGGAVLELQSNGTSAFRMATSSSDSALWEPRNVPVLFATNNTERMRITSGGYLKASNWGSYFYSSNGFHSFDQSISDWTAGFVNYQNSGNSYGIIINYPRNAPNNGGNEFFYCADSSGVRAIIKSNGGFVNYQANDGNLSDIRTKKDIIPLESYWDKFKAIEIVKFKYKDQTHDDYNIGVIAQQVESVAPEFVDIEGFGKDNVPEDGIPLKTIYTADLHHTTIKVLQEAMAKIETLETELTELKALIAAK